MTVLALPGPIVVIAEALLIGFLIGAQREASQGDGHPGVRDFVLIALIGAICGLLQNPWLTAASLLSVVAMLGAFYFQVRPRTGITTDASTGNDPSRRSTRENRGGRWAPTFLR